MQTRHLQSGVSGNTIQCLSHGAFTTALSEGYTSNHKVATGPLYLWEPKHGHDEHCSGTFYTHQQMDKITCPPHTHTVYCIPVPENRIQKTVSACHVECAGSENNRWGVVALTIISVCSYAFFRMLLPWDVHGTSPLPQHQHMDCSPVNCSLQHLYQVGHACFVRSWDFYYSECSGVWNCHSLLIPLIKKFEANRHEIAWIILLDSMTLPWRSYAYVSHEVITWAGPAMPTTCSTLISGAYPLYKLSNCKFA